MTINISSRDDIHWKCYVSYLRKKVEINNIYSVLRQASTFVGFFALSIQFLKKFFESEK